MINDCIIRKMKDSDYDKVHNLWLKISGFGIRSIDDSKEGVIRFIKRNPNTSIVCEYKDEIIGTILCGHDGRSACFYHVCVKEEYRRKGVGSAMVKEALIALTDEHINKVTLIAFTTNEIGNKFWKNTGWKLIENANQYEFTLNKDNITKFNI